MKNSLKIKQSLLTALTISAALTLSACGGGSGGTAATTSVSSSGTPITGVAAKGIISGATVTAYCGGSKANPQVIIGTATTDVNGNYSITPAATCALPVEVVLTPKAGAQMFDEATGKLVTLPSTFTMRAYIANPGSTITTNITPFTDMAAAAINASSSAPTATNVGAAIIAVITSVLGGDDQLYNAKPMSPKDAIASGDLEVKKLSALLTAISAHAHKLNAADIGAGTASALKELEDSAVATITVSGADASVSAAPTGTSAPVDILRSDEGDMAGNISDAGALTISATPVTLPRAPTVTITVSASSPGVTSAKALFTSLRSNLILLSNSGKTGFMDTQVSAVRTDMKGLKRTLKEVANFMSISNHAIFLFSNPSILTTSGFVLYKSGTCYPDATNPAAIDCHWGDNRGADGSGTYHLTVLTQGVANTYNWSDILVTYVGWSPNPGTTSAPQTGTVVNGTLNGTFSGNVAALDSTAHHSHVTFSAALTTSGGNNVYTLTGGVSNLDATGKSLLALTFGTGSNIVVTPPPAGSTASSTFVSAALAGDAVSTNYDFHGNLTTTGTVTDLSGKKTVPASATFTGSITDVTNATVGKFLTGTMTETTDLSSYDTTKLTSAINFIKLNFGFNGSIINSTVTPAMTYAVNMTVDETVFGQKGLSFTYTDPSGNVVTVSRNGATPNTITATSGGVTVVFTKGSGGTVSAGTTSIGTISSKTVSYNDGTFESL
jgi:hypothetical protein